ncbi:MAG: hypothetical protein AB1938_07130 [Myxococcota bacterium]
MAGQFSGMCDSLLAEVDGASELDDVEPLIRLQSDTSARARKRRGGLVERHRPTFRSPRA